MMFIIITILIITGKAFPPQSQGDDFHVDIRHVLSDHGIDFAGQNDRTTGTEGCTLRKAIHNYQMAQRYPQLPLLRPRATTQYINNTARQQLFLACISPNSFKPHLCLASDGPINLVMHSSQVLLFGIVMGSFYYPPV